MNAVVYFSCTGQSRRVASYFATRLGWTLYDMEMVQKREYEQLITVFPVHCQCIPDVVRHFLKTITCRQLIVIATYGRMWHGNVLWEIQQSYPHRIIAAAYVPTKHSYLDGEPFEAYERLESMLHKLTQPSEITLERLFRNPLAMVAPRIRSQLGVKLIKTDACTQCGACAKHCPTGAMHDGAPDRRCIRCLRCVTICEQQAMRFVLRLPMRWYLRKTPCEDVTVYV